MAIAVMAVHRNVTRADFQIIVLAKSERQSARISLEKCRRTSRSGSFWEATTRVVSAAVSKVRDWFRTTVRAGDVSRLTREFLEDSGGGWAAVYAPE
jgi:hypothetical protein